MSTTQELRGARDWHRWAAAKLNTLPEFRAAAWKHTQMADAIDDHLREREQSSIRGKYKGSFSTVDEFLADRKKEDKT